MIDQPTLTNLLASGAVFLAGAGHLMNRAGKRTASNTSLILAKVAALERVLEFDRMANAARDGLIKSLEAELTRIAQTVRESRDKLVELEKRIDNLRCSVCPPEKPTGG